MKKDKNKTDSFEFEGILENSFGNGDYHHPDALTADEILKPESEATSPHSALDSLLKKVQSVSLENKEPEKSKEEVKEEVKPPHKTLLDKCLPYILDENGVDTTQNKEPLYKLASVADILMADSQRTLEKLSKEYGIVFDNDAPTFSEPAEIKEEDVVKEEVEEAKIVSEKPAQIPVISDIDITDSPLYTIKNEDAAVEQTVTFTPITDTEDKTSKIVVSSHTRPIDFTGELLKVNDTSPIETEEVRLEKSEFEEYIPDNEYTDYETGKLLLKKFATAKKREFFSMWGSILLTLLCSVFALPFMSNLLLTQTRTCMIITSVLGLITIILNCKIFLNIGKIFLSKVDSDSVVSFAVLSVILYSVFGIIKGEIVLYMQLLLLMILSFNAVKSFLKSSLMLRSFKQIFNSQPKKALTLINDPAIALAMTKGAVEGETLIAAPQETEMTEDFMKFSTFGKFFNGNMNVITVASLILGILTGVLASVFYNDLLYGFYSGAAVLCFSAVPCLTFIDTLPLYHSSKKLAMKGAMIAGKTGAELIEQANAVVVNVKDIFPTGTVTLHQMKVLSENNLEDIIIRAASLTEAMQSPLAPIFQKIAGNSNITAFPDSDTVKYEEALGISGWVDNRLLFIGNRTLMEAHGISVPDVELDRKILRQGFFPVYVASGNKACALLIIRYEVSEEVSKELKRLTNSGITLLVKTSDPNITEAMICDYIGLYEDTVKVMTAAGCHIYVNTVAPVKSFSAPAVFRANPTALPAILNSAGRIKRSNILLTASYIISAVLGILLFAYTSFGGLGSLLSDTTILLYSIFSTIITYLVYLTQKP